MISSVDESKSTSFFVQYCIHVTYALMFIRVICPDAKARERQRIAQQLYYLGVVPCVMW